LRVKVALFAIFVTGLVAWHGSPAQPPVSAARGVDPLADKFTSTVKPLLERYCYSCHGAKKQEASLDLSRDGTPAAIAKNFKHWDMALQRLKDGEMPPEDAARQPKAEERAAVIEWLKEFRTREAERHAGDPGVVLARRLSNAEYDYTIRDLTGVDIRPTREFPVDPANEAGFDNSGESLAMSPALLKKYLAAARHIADHVVLKPEGFVFAPHPAVTDPDRDKYCVKRILDFYVAHQVELADYFYAAWRYQKRADRNAELDTFADESKLSLPYLKLIWSLLTESGEAAGPLAAIRQSWNELPKENARPACIKLRDQVLSLRKQYKPKIDKPSVKGISAGSQSFLLWANNQLAAKHRTYSGDEKDPVVRASIERFCNVFPDTFVVADRSTGASVVNAAKGRPLTAGFHLMQGYFRDDGPLCELILNDRERKELDLLWKELDFIAHAPERQYQDFIFFERAEPPRFMAEAEFDFARSEDKDASSEAKMKRLAVAYLGKAKRNKASETAIQAIETYFAEMSATLRAVEKARVAAEPSHLDSLVKFAEQAYRRPLLKSERDDILGFYQQLRQKDGLEHEEAIRDSVAAVLMSPHFCYRLNLADGAAGISALAGYELANRLSYFLWSSLPDEELLARAAAGDLHKPEILAIQIRRMLSDPRVRGLATEFAGNWLDFRRFEEHNAVDRDRFPTFTNELRQAMFEEPVRYFMDVVQHNRSVLDILYGKDTFVNRSLAKHYGISFSTPPVRERSGAEGSEWLHIEDAAKFGRGGMLPMAVFLTKNAPGLRTNPVKRGYWVVRRVLGETIPPPPPNVGELPKDEAKLGELTLPQLLAKHRDSKACAGCHQRFDSVGLAFEGFGPVGELRNKDLGGKPVSTMAKFPDGKARDGLAGLQTYLKDKRQHDYIDNLCRKLFSYALGRTLLPSDDKALSAMKAKLEKDGYAFRSLVESIVMSPQFLNKRGREP
jgi:hypothetical protein